MQKPKGLSHSANVHSAPTLQRPKALLFCCSRCLLVLIFTVLLAKPLGHVKNWF